MLVVALLISVVLSIHGSRSYILMALLVVVVELVVALISMASNCGFGCVHDSGSGRCRLWWCTDGGISVFLVNLMADKIKESRNV
jgi:hypothetical protein